MSGEPQREIIISRRELLAMGGAAMALALTGSWATAKPAAALGPSSGTIPLDGGWLFGGRYVEGSERAGFDDSRFRRVTIPHANRVFSWRNVDRGAYQYVSIYRRHFSVPPEWRSRRVFVDFGAAMTASTVTINGRQLGEYKGGYTPFSFELTPDLNRVGDNVLAVKVDSRRSRRDIPPFGGREIDFDTFGGIYGEVSLRAFPMTFIGNVFAKPVNVLEPGRRVDVRCYLNSAAASSQTRVLEAELLDGRRRVARATKQVTLAPGGQTVVDLTLGNLGQIELWDVDNPKLYGVRVRLLRSTSVVHGYRTRIGFREAVFEPNGFFLNGRRLKIFGLNRHQLFPYVGNAMPARVQRRDAEILKRELNCNMVRTSHYVQSPHFLDACDELGLLVFEEIPGWNTIGDRAWQDLSVRDVGKMVRRDWNHPSVVTWGVRINESNDNDDFYARTNRAARELDDSRPTTGARRGDLYDSTFLEDLFSFNNYGRNPDGTVGLRPPRNGIPYLVSEVVGQFDYTGDGAPFTTDSLRPSNTVAYANAFDSYYLRTSSVRQQQLQADRHAQAHNLAASDNRYAGALAWCAFEYNSPINSVDSVKTPGVCDIFRIPKPGASFYRSQLDPRVRPAIEPAFYWDFGPRSRQEPGPIRGDVDAMICSNCERLEVYVGGERFATLTPDRGRYGQLPYPPSFVDLSGVDGSGLPELRIDGYLGERKEISRSFSADTGEDRLLVVADDQELHGDGIDATRVVLRAVDEYGNQRPFVTGGVRIQMSGPGWLIGDNPFSFTEAGGAGAVWVRTKERSAGEILVRAAHESLGAGEALIRVK